MDVDSRRTCHNGGSDFNVSVQMNVHRSIDALKKTVVKNNI